MEIILPPHINADGLLPFIAQLSQPLLPDEGVVINFSYLRRVTPASLVALSSVVDRWRSKERRLIVFAGLEKCPITDYLQRMDLLNVCEVELPENFIRHEAKGRFVPVRNIDPARVDEMGHELASCIAPGGDAYGQPLSDLYDLAWYVFTETANNVHQHSRGTGCAAAQVVRSEGLVKIALADNGRGILKSFQDAGLPWSTDMDDVSALRKALEPRVSSKGKPSNEGVGLTLVSNLVRLVRGWMMIVSETGILNIRPDGGVTTSLLPDGARFKGTLIGLTFRQDIHDYPSLLERAKLENGLLQQRSALITFRP